MTPAPSTHTPGPWQVTSGCCEQHSHFADGRPAVAIAYYVAAANQKGMDGAANARLIASAPALLAFVRDVANRDDGALSCEASRLLSSLKEGGAA